MTADEDPDALARRAADAMWSRDAASQALGMTVEEVGPGRARLSMTVREDMVNGHGLCHGGLVFALADSAFAFACNSRNQASVAQHCAITYLRPARLGERLTATAVEHTLVGRTGVTDVTVRTAEGAIVAQFRGASRTIAGAVTDEPQGGGIG